MAVFLPMMDGPRDGRMDGWIGWTRLKTWRLNQPILPSRRPVLKYSDSIGGDFVLFLSIDAFHKVKVTGLRYDRMIYPSILGVLTPRLNQLVLMRLESSCSQSTTLFLGNIQKKTKKQKNKTKKKLKVPRWRKFYFLWPLMILFMKRKRKKEKKIWIDF